MTKKVTFIHRSAQVTPTRNKHRLCRQRGLWGRAQLSRSLGPGRVGDQPVYMTLERHRVTPFMQTHQPMHTVTPTDATPTPRQIYRDERHNKITFPHVPPPSTDIETPSPPWPPPNTRTFTGTHTHTYQAGAGAGTAESPTDSSVHRRWSHVPTPSREGRGLRQRL